MHQSSLTGRLAIIVLALVTGSCATINDEPRTSAAAITNGTVDTGDPAVVLVVGKGCTGTLVSPRVVLTAGHCAEGVVADSVRFDASDGSQEHRYVIAQHAHPRLSVDLEHDVGMIVLAAEAPAWAVAVPMRRAPFDDGFVGMPIRIVGYGADPAANGSGKREGATRIQEFTDREFVFGPEPSQTCRGDSGGPAFATLDGVEYLIGVTSAGDLECVEFARDMRVDAYMAEFIDGFLDGAVDRVGDRCYYDENCTSGLCYAPIDTERLYCSTSCASDAGCPSTMICDGRLCRHPLPSPGALGGECSASTDCDSTLCTPSEPNSDGSICSELCFSAAECPDGFECLANPALATEGLSSCLPPRPPSGCSIGDGHRGDAALMLLLLVAVLALRTRQSG